MRTQLHTRRVNRVEIVQMGDEPWMGALLAGMNEGITTWFPIAVVLGLTGLVVGTMVTINRLMGPSRVHTAIKGEPFECGNPAQRHRLGTLLGALLPDCDSVPGLRRRGGVSLSVGGRAAAARDVRLRRSARLYRHSGGRPNLRLAKGRARLGLARPRYYSRLTSFPAVSSRCYRNSFRRDLSLLADFRE